ncbi:hypothetical protein [Actinomadura sp. SCN-SB]|uniref:hypothetical protein n=1 Tax=Actinomadura sp. SCN-SB TaxID=3373092 RepID=UPI003752FE9A
MVVRDIFESRKGHFVGRDMKIGRPHPTDYRDPTYLLAGILRCGKRLPDGALCNTPLRSNRHKDAKLFFKLAPGLEQQIAQIRADKAKHDAAIAAKRERADASAAEIRRRWYLPEKKGGFPISVKQTYIRSALHAVIVYPAGKGNKRFSPDLLDPIWRTD